MENTTESKSGYIEAWNSHIDNFDILAFCPSVEDHNAVKECQDKLRELVLKIANTKKFTEA